MTDEKYVYLLHEQKIIKPKIEDVIPYVLDGDMRNIALDFCAYLRANNMKLVWANENGWRATYNGKIICSIRLATDSWKKSKHLKDMYGNHSWNVTPYIERNLNKYEHIIMNEGLQNFIWDNVHKCMFCRTPCHGKMPPYRDKVVLGKKIEKICHGRELTWVFDPDEAAIDCIKRLLELEKQARDNNG